MQITLQQQTSPLGKWNLSSFAPNVLFRRFADQEPTSPFEVSDFLLPMREILWVAFAVIQQSKYERRCTVNVEAYGYSAAPRFGCKHCGIQYRSDRGTTHLVFPVAVKWLKRSAALRKKACQISRRPSWLLC
jgi:hypothetical protein